MSRLVRAELLKLRTARTFWGLAGVTLGMVALVAALTLALEGDPRTEARVRSLLSTAGSSGVLLLVLGAVVSAGEHRHGTIAWTLLVTPNRRRVVVAQALACAGAGAAVGLAAAGLTGAVVLPWLSAHGAPTLSIGELLGLFLGGVLYTALASALGAGVGALLRNQVAAVMLVLVIVFVIDPTATTLVEDYAKYSLTGLGVVLSGASAEEIGGADSLPIWLAALLCAGYAGVVVLGAATLTSRRDI